MAPTVLKISPAGPSKAPVFLFAHGAGAPMDSAFMDTITEHLVAKGITVARFEFQYMALRRVDARKRLPPRIEDLILEFEGALETARALNNNRPMFIGGKSMGGRIATMIAERFFQQRHILGCLCFGYPLHPAKRPEKLRTAHLAHLKCPTLVLQGDRDALGNRLTVEKLALPDSISWTWLTDGDHDLHPRKTSGFTQSEHLAAAANAAATFVHQLHLPGKARMRRAQVEDVALPEVDRCDLVRQKLR